MFVRAWLVVVVDVVVECDNCSERGHERLRQQRDLYKSRVILYTYMFKYLICMPSALHPPILHRCPR